MSDDPEQEFFADGMVEEITTAIARVPWLFVIARNSSFTYKGQLRCMRAARNQPQAAIEALERSLRLSPFAPMCYLAEAALSLAYLVARQFEEAIIWADRALHGQQRFTPALRAKVVALAWLGRTDEARTELRRLLAVDATFTVDRYQALIARSYAPEFVDLMVAGFRRAGLQEG